MIKRLFLFYKNEFLEGVNNKKLNKNEIDYSLFAMVFGTLPFLILSILFSPLKELTYLFLLTFLPPIVKILFDYKSSITNFIINLLIILIYIEVDIFYNGEYVIYAIFFSGLSLFLNNLFLNKKGLGKILKLSSFSIYYLTSGFLSVFEWITQRINIAFLIFPIIYLFIVTELYISNSISIFSNILTNGIIEEINKQVTINKAFGIYLIIFFIANYKRIFSFFNRIRFFSISFFAISLIFILKWFITSGITKSNLATDLFNIYILYGFWYLMYSVYLPLLKPKVINEIDYGNNIRSFAVQVLEKEKNITFNNFLKYCDKKYINENYKYHSELNDQPIDGINKEDLLNRGDFISYLNNVISSITVDIRNKRSYNSYSIGLIGNWGEGKTSIINILLKKYLNINSLGINTLKFNPWNYKKDDLVLSFFNEIEDALGYGYDKDFHVYLNTLGYLGTTGSILSKFFLGISSIIYGDRSINKIKEKLNKKLSDRNEILLVIVDDLDRCTPDEVLIMLNILKNLGDLSNIIYLVSYDKIAIENILKENGYLKNYLDKVINQELFIPEPTQEDKNKYILDEIKNILNFIATNYFNKNPNIKKTLKLASKSYMKYDLQKMFKDDNLRTIKKVLNLFKYNLIDFIDLLNKKKLFGKTYEYSRTTTHHIGYSVTPEEVSQNIVINILKETKASILDYELYNIIRSRDGIMLTAKYGARINEIKEKSKFDDYLIENFLRKKLTYDKNGVIILYDRIGENLGKN